LLFLQGLASIIDSWLVMKGQAPSTSGNPENQ